MMYLIIKTQISEIIRHNDCSALPPPSSFPSYPLNSIKLKLLVFSLVYSHHTWTRIIIVGQPVILTYYIVSHRIVYSDKIVKMVDKFLERLVNVVLINTKALLKLSVHNRG